MIGRRSGLWYINEAKSTTVVRKIARLKKAYEVRLVDYEQKEVWYVKRKKEEV